MLTDRFGLLSIVWRLVHPITSRFSLAVALISIAHLRCCSSLKTSLPASPLVAGVVVLSSIVRRSQAPKPEFAGSAIKSTENVWLQG